MEFEIGSPFFDFEPLSIKSTSCLHMRKCVFVFIECRFCSNIYDQALLTLILLVILKIGGGLYRLIQLSHIQILWIGLLRFAIFFFLLPILSQFSPVVLMPIFFFLFFLEDILFGKQARRHIKYSIIVIGFTVWQIKFFRWIVSDKGED